MPNEWSGLKNVVKPVGGVGTAATVVGAGDAVCVGAVVAVIAAVAVGCVLSAAVWPGREAIMSTPIPTKINTISAAAATRNKVLCCMSGWAGAIVTGGAAAAWDAMGCETRGGVAGDGNGRDSLPAPSRGPEGRAPPEGPATAEGSAPAAGAGCATTGARSTVTTGADSGAKMLPQLGQYPIASAASVNLRPQ